MSAPRSADIIVCGIGGQGVMTAADLIAQTAVTRGYDCKKTEIAGMSQRGGAVTSHVRFAERVLSPIITPGAADLVVAFELAEVLRWARYLRGDGIAVVNTIRISPPVVSFGLYSYPADPLAELRAAGITVHAIDASVIARELGDAKLVNTIMLGAIARFLPFPAEDLEAIIVERFHARGSELVELNRRAYAAGAEASSTGAAYPCAERPAVQPIR